MRLFYLVIMILFIILFFVWVFLANQSSNKKIALMLDAMLVFVASIAIIGTVVSVKVGGELTALAKAEAETLKEERSEKEDDEENLIKENEETKDTETKDTETKEEEPAPTEQAPAEDNKIQFGLPSGLDIINGDTPQDGDTEVQDPEAGAADGEGSGENGEGDQEKQPKDGEDGEREENGAPQGNVGGSGAD